MANKKINELDTRATLGLSDLMVVADPSTGYAYKTTLTDLKTLTGGGVVSFNGRVGAITPTEGDYGLTQLSDVIITTATSGQVLRYNGTSWVNSAEQSIPVTSVFGRTGAVVATEGDYTLNLLGDVTITTPTNGQVLKYNGTAWINDSGASISGTTNYVPKFTSSNALGNSNIQDDGTLITLGINTSVTGTATATTSVVAPFIQGTRTSTVGGTNGSIVGRDLTTPAKRIDIGYASNINGGFISVQEAGVDWRPLFINPIASIAASVVIGRTTDDGVNKLQVVGSGLFTTNLTASSLIKSGGTSAQILAADGSVITAGTGITISGGTISSSGGGGGSMAIGGTITSATAGSVLFAGTSGVLAQDNANFFWDDTNNRLGIGTATPSAILHSVGSVTATSALAIGNYMQPTLVAAANNDVLVGLDINPTFTLGAFTGTTILGLRVNGKIRATSNIEINGTASASPEIKFISAGFNSNNQGIDFASKFGLGYTESNSIQRLYIYNGNVNLDCIRIYNATGNIGMGISTNGADAGFRLDVNGTARVSGILTLGATSGVGMSIRDNVAIRGTALTGGNIYIDANSVIDNTGTINLRGQVTMSSSLIVATTLRVNGSSISLPFNGSLRTTSASNGQIFIDPAIDLTGSVFVRGTTFVVENLGGVPTTYASALVSFNSTTKGFLPPRMTSTNKTSIASPVAGLIVFDTTLNKLCVFTTAWETITSA